jgi:hypothetical protein
MHLISPTMHPSWQNACDILKRCTTSDRGTITPVEIRDTISSIHALFASRDSMDKFADIPKMLESLPRDVLNQFCNCTFPQLCHDITHELGREFEGGLVPSLPQQVESTIWFTPIQAYLLISSTFLCIPLLSEDGESARLHGTCHLFFTNRPRLCNKLHCLVNYFNIVAAARRQQLPREIAEVLIAGDRKIFLERLVASKSRGAEWWMNEDSTLSKVDYREPFERIENAKGAVQADFANKFPGGGVLRRGCVQEEIRFIISPECLLSVFVCEKMSSNEAVLIKNTISFSDYAGYGSSFKCLGFSQQLTELFTNSVAQVELDDVLAIDAIPFGLEKDEQFSLVPTLRELEKCRVGLSYSSDKPFATGNWGCGVFGGDTQLKAVIQWLAASVNGKNLIYHPFDDAQTSQLPELVALVARRRDVTVGMVFGLLVKGFLDSQIKHATTIRYLIHELGQSIPLE